MTSILFSRSRRTASIRSGRAGGLAGELGKDVRSILFGAGLKVKEANDPTARLEVRTQIKVLDISG